MTCGHTSGNPDCHVRDCRRRWLVGTTTGEHYRPAPLASLLVDILETWDRRLFTMQQLYDVAETLRPGLDAEVCRVTAWQVRCQGGAPVGGQWVPVECGTITPDIWSTSTANNVWTFRVPHRNP